MNNSRFIELLNLYVDQQLSREEAAELEHEIVQDPKRAQMYQQYCRMQKACSLLFENERIQAPHTGVLAAALSEADRKVVGYPDFRPNVFRRTTFAFAGLATAACFAFVLVHRFTDETASAFAQNSQAAKPVTKSFVASHQLSGEKSFTPLTAAKIFPVSAQSTRRPEYFTVFTPRASLNEENHAGDLVVESPQDNRVSYEWMRGVELSPVGSLSDRITLASTASVPPTRSLRNTPTAAQNQESAAFQFQR